MPTQLGGGGPNQGHNTADAACARLVDETIRTQWLVKIMRRWATVGRRTLSLSMAPQSLSSNPYFNSPALRRECKHGKPAAVMKDGQKNTREQLEARGHVTLLIPSLPPVSFGGASSRKTGSNTSEVSVSLIAAATPTSTGRLSWIQRMTTTLATDWALLGMTPDTDSIKTAKGENKLIKSPCGGGVCRRQAKGCPPPGTCRSAIRFGTNKSSAFRQESCRPKSGSKRTLGEPRIRNRQTRLTSHLAGELRGRLIFDFQASTFNACAGYQHALPSR